MLGLGHESLLDVRCQMLSKFREWNTLIEELADEAFPFILVDQQLLEGGDDRVYPVRSIGAS